MVFLTPLVTNKELIKHCHSKALEYRGKEGLKDILSVEFDVLVHDEDFYAEELIISKAMISSKVQLNIEEPKNDEVIDWKQCETQGIKNLSRKVRHVFSDTVKADKYIDLQVRNYIRGQRIINHLENNFTELYEKKTRIKNNIAIHLEEEILLSEEPPLTIIKETISKYKMALIREKFEDILEYGITENLSKEAIADWLISCQLDFGGE